MDTFFQPALCLALSRQAALELFLASEGDALMCPGTGRAGAPAGLPCPMQAVPCRRVLLPPEPFPFWRRQTGCPHAAVPKESSFIFREPSCGARLGWGVCTWLDWVRLCPGEEWGAPAAPPEPGRGEVIESNEDFKP